MKKIPVILAVLLSLIVGTACSVSAARNSGSRKGSREHLENVAVEMKIVVTDSEKNERVYRYEFNAQPNREITFAEVATITATGSKLPEANESKTNESPPVHGGITLSFTVYAMHGPLTVHSRIEICERPPSTSGFSLSSRSCVLELKSVHESPQPIRVFSGDCVAVKQSIVLFVSASTTK